ncbi:MAG: AraC family transcriptional regulator [Candidatus Limnocylindrales bacterium]
MTWHDAPMRARQWVTFKSPDVWFGEFDLPAGDPEWQREARVSDGVALIAFPGSAVLIHQVEHGPLVADSMRAVMYAPGSIYRRAVVAPEGDRCSFMGFDARLAAEAAAPFDRVAVGDPASYRFPFAAAALEAPDFMLKQRVRSRLADADVDPGEVRERLYWLIDRAVQGGYRGLGTKRLAVGGRQTTRREHRDLVENVRKLIGRDPSAPLSIDQLAGGVAASPFHLSRVFRRETGSSVHSYRTQLRLRASVERVAAGERLADVALDLGFASQAHFADRFRRAYGVPPAAWRRQLGNGRQMSKIMKEAAGRAA